MINEKYILGKFILAVVYRIVRSKKMLEGNMKGRKPFN